MKPADITQYLDMVKRRKWWIIIPFLLTLLAGMNYAMTAPKIYESETLILVQSPRVPEDYVRSIISTSAEDRLRTITQQVTSRTNLEKIIEGYDLYHNPRLGNTMMDQKVQLLRGNINIQITGGRRRSAGSSFTIAFRSRDPEKAMEVTNALASRFITENLRIREFQALGTSSFLADELESIEKRLMDKEEDLKQYREKYLGGLPQQLQTNLSILDRLQQQLDQLNNNLRDAENRKIVIQQEIAATEGRIAQTGTFLPSQGGDGESLIFLKNRLASLKAKYTQQHPDVIRLQKMIDKLEDKEPETESGSTEESPVLSQPGQELRRQLRNIDLSISNFTNEIKKVKSQIAGYQTKVEETPKREQELLSINRDYRNLQELYNSLLARKLEAEIAVSMEKKQKGEQFRIIDPAKIPDFPISLNIRKILLMSLAIGLGLGCGLAFFTETMDTSYKTPDDAENDLQLPVLVSLPIQHTERELKNLKRNNVLAFAAVVLGFILSVIGIIFATKGVDKTLDFAKKLLSGT